MAEEIKPTEMENVNQETSDLVLVDEAAVDEEDHDQGSDHDDQGSDHDDEGSDHDNPEYDEGDPLNSSDVHMSEPSIPASQVQELVAQALEKKMGEMQQQMHAMVQAMTGMKNLSQKSEKKGVPKEELRKEDFKKQHPEEWKKMEEERKKKRRRERNEVPYWKQLIADVRSILDIKDEVTGEKKEEVGDNKMEVDVQEEKGQEKSEGKTEEKSDSKIEVKGDIKMEEDKADVAVGGEKKEEPCKSLPPHKHVSEIWTAVDKDFNPEKMQKTKPHVLYDYRWPSEAYDKFGTAPYMDDEFFGADEGKGQHRFKSVLGAEEYEIEERMREIDNHSRALTKAASHGVHFLEALTKGWKKEKEVSEETMNTIILGLNRCLFDIMDTAVRGSVNTSVLRRRKWIKHMHFKDEVAKKNLLNLPVEGKRLFAGRSKEILKKPNNVFPMSERYQVQLKRRKGASGGDRSVISKRAKQGEASPRAQQRQSKEGNNSQRNRQRGRQQGGGGQKSGGAGRQQSMDRAKRGAIPSQRNRSRGSESRGRNNSNQSFFDFSRNDRMSQNSFDSDYGMSRQYYGMDSMQNQGWGGLPASNVMSPTMGSYPGIAGGFKSREEYLAFLRMNTMDDSPGGSNW